MTETPKSKRGGRAPGTRLSDEARARYGDRTRAAWADPDKRANLLQGSSDASKRGWETRRARAAEAALLADGIVSADTPGDAENGPEEGTQ